MYCFTYASSYDCIFNELILWSDISSEHPVFIKTVADLSGKKLPQDIEQGLARYNKDFTELKEKVIQIREQLTYSKYYSNDIGTEIKRLVTEFIIMDENYLIFLSKVRKVAPEDRVWQTLLEHIIEEQTFMKKLFEDLRVQLS